MIFGKNILRRKNMKNKNVLIKLIAAILVVGLTAVLFAGCKQSQEVVMSFEKDGKTYTITEEEFALLMKVRKRLFFQRYSHLLGCSIHRRRQDQRTVLQRPCDGTGESRSR